MQMNIHEAKAKLSALVELAASGENVIIAKAGKPIARLVAYEQKQMPRPIGLLKGRITISDDFNSESQEVNSLFYKDAL